MYRLERAQAVQLSDRVSGIAAQLTSQEMHSTQMLLLRELVMNHVVKAHDMQCLTVLETLSGEWLECCP